MTYDFDEEIDRRGAASMKWGLAREGELPMWVADMDFRTAPCVIDALRRCVDHGVFGYAQVTPEYREAVSFWWRRRHQLEVASDSILFCSGMVAAISSVARSLVAPEGKVLVQSPVYNGFYHAIHDAKRTVVESPLIYEAGAYRMDFADLAERLADPAITLLVLCNPQNPTGNVWSVGDLARLGELCAEHGVTVLSDEAHCDLTRPGLSHTPFARVNEQCRRISVTCCSPSKPFNIAGIQSSYLFVDDPELRERIAQGLLEDCFSMPNDFACASTVAAYEGGEEWLDELRAYIQANKDLFASFVDEWIPGLTVVPSDAMYLSWVDVSGLTDDSEALAAFLREKAKLFVTQGDEYGTGGKGFLRVNLATNRARVEEGLRRLEAGCAAFREERGLN